MRRPGTRGRSNSRGIFIAAVVIFILSISTIVRFYTDLLWFRELRFEKVFIEIIWWKFLPALVFGVGLFLFLFINLFMAMRLRPIYGFHPDDNDPLDRYRRMFMPYLRWLALGGSAALAFLFALGFVAEWERFLLASNQVPFGTVDDVFQRDLSFYVFRLPAYQFIYGWLFTALLVVTIAVAAVHYLTGGIRPQSPVQRFSPQVKAHVSVLLGLIAIVRAWGYRLDQFNLLYSTRGDVTGASYTDIHAELKALQLLVVIAFIGAAIFLINIRFRGWTLPLVGVGLWFLTSVVAAGAFPYFTQRFRVEPSQLQREKPFIERNIKATRAAYGLDKMKITEYPANPGPSAQVIDANPGTIQNVRLYDPFILKTAYRQLEEFRQYYEFNDVDVDRYKIGGSTRQVMLSARELVLANLESLSWVNNHLFYTHGYGAVVTPTNETSNEGRPAFLVQNIPPQSDAPELEIKQGGIYYGEKITDYSVVKTEQEELDFGQQDRNVLTRYSGKGGVELSGPMRRLAFAWRFRDVNLLISGLIKEDSKIIYFRQIRERLTKAAPFLHFDGDPYPVITDGRLVWMIDGYTATDMYPYSERVDFTERTRMERGIGEASISGRKNYIRNSVKATIDAFDGTTKFYVWDEKDPVIGAWRKAFPTLFEDAERMPAGLREHVRYPEDMFRIQTSVYRNYHVTDPVTFFTKEDRWIIPKNPSVGEGATAQTQAEEIQPYFVLMKLPGSTEEGYFLILPMNPRDRGNMVSYVAANSDPESYGELIDFRFPKTKTIFGIGQIHSRINQDVEFSKEKSLLDQRGSKLEDGNLLVIPIGESLLYIQPMFLRAERNAIPELRFVALATLDRVVVGRSLDEALQLIKEGKGSTVALPREGEERPGGQSIAELVDEALAHLKAADDAARRGDWATYGREQEAARRALEEANAQSGGSPSPSPSP